MDFVLWVVVERASWLGQRALQHQAGDAAEGAVQLALGKIASGTAGFRGKARGA